MQSRPLLAITLSMVLTMLLLPQTVRAADMTKGRPVAPFTPGIKPGEYVWNPEISPSGPVVIIISLPEQVLYVYRNGVRIGRSTVSSGKTGRHTPTGVFTILQKAVTHTSSLFKGASMPYMERLTWGGVAMHAGYLPGHPASHGCVRLPVEFAKKLYTVTSDGTTVIITDGRSSPGNTTAPGLLFAAAPGDAAPPGGVVWRPEKAPAGQVFIMISSADGAAYVYRNGVEIGRAPVGRLHGIAGSYVFVALANVDAEGRRDWLAVTSVGGTAPVLKDLVKQVRVDPVFLAGTRALVTPGTTLVLTDAPVNTSTRSGTGFNILTTAEVP